MAFGTANGWSLAGLDRWSTYRGAFVYKMHRDLMNVELLDRWSSYRGGALDRFDCIYVFSLCMTIIMVLVMCSPGEPGSLHYPLP